MPVDLTAVHPCTGKVKVKSMTVENAFLRMHEWKLSNDSGYSCDDRFDTRMERHRCLVSGTLWGKLLVNVDDAHRVWQHAMVSVSKDDAISWSEPFGGVSVLAVGVL